MVLQFSGFLFQILGSLKFFLKSVFLATGKILDLAAEMHISVLLLLFLKQTQMLVVGVMVLMNWKAFLSGSSLFPPLGFFCDVRCSKNCLTPEVTDHMDSSLLTISSVLFSRLRLSLII